MILKIVFYSISLRLLLLMTHIESPHLPRPKKQVVNLNGPVILIHRQDSKKFFFWSCSASPLLTSGDDKQLGLMTPYRSEADA